MRGTTASIARKGARARVSIRDGTVIVGSDGHYWPQKKAPTGHRALVHFARELKPDAIVYNGDAFDGAKVSRHARIGWENNPEVAEELAVVAERLSEIEDAAPKAELVWTLGNHDMRYETFLANKVPEYRGVKGIHLKDHFPAWLPAWSVEVGGKGGAFIKHRFKGGANAAKANALASGRTTITAHRHALQCQPVSDMDETRWGCDSGMLGEPYGPMFTGYTEDNPVDWRAGFLVLTFHKGLLLPPELVHVLDKNRVAFRGEIIQV